MQRPFALSPERQPLVQPEDLRYEGAFRLPSGDGLANSFEYGGTALAYNPEHDSLFLIGHDQYQLATEIKIPRITKSDSLGDLETAVYLQPFADPSDKKMYRVDDLPVSGGDSIKSEKPLRNGEKIRSSETIKVGGLLVYRRKLIGSAYIYYDADGHQVLSQFNSSTDLTEEHDAHGMYEVGDLGAGFVSGWMAELPHAWQHLFQSPVLTGQCCIPIISRSSYGPAALGIDPAEFARRKPTPATPLVYYPAAHPTLGDWGSNSTYFNGTTTMGGMVFPKGTRSLVFFGRQGLGPFCYNTGEACGDPTDSSKGTHGYPYTYQAWAYDARDLMSVKSGKMEPWEALPYKVWQFDLPFASDKKAIGGVAYDSAGNRVFVSQQFGDGTRPVIHVFSVHQGHGASE